MVVVQLKRKRAYVSEMTVRSFRLILRTFPNIISEDFDIGTTFIRQKDEIDHVAKQFLTIKGLTGRTLSLSTLSESEIYEIFTAFRQVHPEMFTESKKKVASPTSEPEMAKINTGLDSDVSQNLDLSILTLERLGYGNVLDMPYSLMTQAMIHAKKK